MKKMSALTLSVLIFSGCLFGGNQSNTGNETKPPEKPFSFDLPTPTDEASIAYYTENDSTQTLYAATPYYMGAQPSTLSGFVKYDELKKKKVEKAIQLTKENITASEKLKSDMEVFKSAYLEFVGTARTVEKRLGKFSNESGGKMVENAMKEEALIANIESINTSSLKNAQALSLYEYQKTTLALALSNAVLEDYTYLFASSGVVANLFSNTSDATIKTALTDFESQMEKVPDLNTNLNDVKNKSLAIAAALK